MMTITIQDRANMWPWLYKNFKDDAWGCQFTSIYCVTKFTFYDEHTFKIFLLKFA
jgi:hypothetical protein